jgi:tRNA modification GTPase
VLWLGPEGAGPSHPHLLEVEAKADDPAHKSKSASTIKLSAKTGYGLTELVDWLTETGSTLLPPPDSFAINQRQHVLLTDASKSLQRAAEAEDLLVTAEELRHVRLALDALTGRAGTEDMLDALFGRFCIGK